MATAEKDSDEDAIGRFVEVTGIAQVVEIDGTRLDPYFRRAVPAKRRRRAARRQYARSNQPGRPAHGAASPGCPSPSSGGTATRSGCSSELEQALAALSDLSAKVIGQTIFALTTGAVAPDYELPASGRTHERDKHETKGRRQ